MYRLLSSITADHFFRCASGLVAPLPEDIFEIQQEYTDFMGSTVNDGSYIAKRQIEWLNRRIVRLTVLVEYYAAVPAEAVKQALMMDNITGATVDIMRVEIKSEVANLERLEADFRLKKEKKEGDEVESPYVTFLQSKEDLANFRKRPIDSNMTLLEYCIAMKTVQQELDKMPKK